MGRELTPPHSVPRALIECGCSRGSARLVFSPPPSLFARFCTVFLSALSRGSSLASLHPSFVLDFSLDEGDLMFLSALDIFYLDSLVFVVCICLVIYRMFTLSLCSFTEIYVPLGNLSTFPLGINRWSVTLVQLSNTSFRRELQWHSNTMREPGLWWPIE